MIAPIYGRFIPRERRGREIAKLRGKGLTWSDLSEGEGVNLKHD